MDNEQILNDIKTGKKRLVSKFEYFFNYWTPIIALVTILVSGIFWFANANGRMFTTENIKYETEQNTILARQRTFDKLDERYMKRNEMIDLKHSIENLQKDIVKLTVELAKNRN